MIKQKRSLALLYQNHSSAGKVHRALHHHGVALQNKAKDRQLSRHVREWKFTNVVFHIFLTILLINSVYHKTHQKASKK
jgi:hypothetical protein